MSGNVQPIFPQVPNWGTAVLGGTAVTTRTLSGSGSATLGFTCGVRGSRLDSITIIATGTTVVGVIRIWRQLAGAGDAFLVSETLVTAITPSTTVAVFSSEILPVNWVGGVGDLFYASSHTTDAFAVHFRGGDY